ncbi:hypothetical protein AB0M54_07390 [Actinoplanes sp. NPDC051470]|uniref:hypothetical protein n=1 Tax=Actinoplanes sp. NPDC051470 TaxID=3157224 RepID=UPI00341EC779
MTEYDQRNEKRPSTGRRTNVIAIGVAVVAVLVAVAAWVVPGSEPQASPAAIITVPATTTAEPSPPPLESAEPTESADPSEPAADPSSSESAPVDAVAGAEPRRAESITLNNGYVVDLDTDNPNWNVRDYCDNCDLDFDNGFINKWGGGLSRLQPGDPGTLATCEAATAYTEVIGRRELKPGFRFCVAGRNSRAVIEVTKANNMSDDFVGDDSVIFDVKAWF